MFVVKYLPTIPNKRRVHVLLFIILIAFTVISINNFQLHETVIDKINNNYKYYSNNGPLKKWRAQTPSVDSVAYFPADHTNIIFPRDFKHGSYKDMKAYYNNYFASDETHNKIDDENLQQHVFKYDGPVSALTKKVQSSQFKQHNLSLYDATKNLNGDMNQCGKINKPLSIDITNFNKIDDGLIEMVHVLQHQLQYDESMLELNSFFKDDLAKQLEEGTSDKHWFKFAGTSVWLEQYGVHMMISRALYSNAGLKRSPNLSLTYAQIFDENWNELKNVELVVPTTNPIGNHERVYKNLPFPSFLPIPFYHNSKYQRKRFYGAEDPRIMLIKNEDGIEEPLIVFNAYHRKLEKSESISEKEMKSSLNYYRSMFMCWPFQFQIGKQNVDGFADPQYDKIAYNKVVELRRGEPRLEVQKNWTPFISIKERAANANLHDKYVYFIYRWSHLEVLKCPLTRFNAFGESVCSFAYKRDENLPADADVGPLRGGTEMVSLNSLLPPHLANPPKPQHDQEVWIGFARAHIKRCGCGKDMYRPNLAVLTREDDKFKISQLSSFTSFDIPVDGWTIADVQCAPKDPNALIPNGISSWVAKGTTDIKGRKVIEDYLTLSLSVADASVHTVHIKNLLSKLVSQTSFTTFDKDLGYSNDVVDCSLKSSINFCKTYGEEQKKLGTHWTPPPPPPPPQSKPEDKPKDGNGQNKPN